MTEAVEQIVGVCPTTSLVERQAGEIFYSPEMPARYLYVLVKGRVTEARLTPDGNRLATGVLEPRDVFGDLSLGEESPTNEFARAQTDYQAIAWKRPQRVRSSPLTPRWRSGSWLRSRAGSP